MSCVENHFEELEQAWDDMYAFRLGFWRAYVMTVIYKYLDCGDLHFGLPIPLRSHCNAGWLKWLGTQNPMILCSFHEMLTGCWELQVNWYRIKK